MSILKTAFVCLVLTALLPLQAADKGVSETLNDLKVKTEETKYYTHDLVLDAMTSDQKTEFKAKIDKALKAISEARVQIKDHWNNLDRTTQRQVLLEKEKKE